MPTSLPNRSFRERRTAVMLNEGTAFDVIETPPLRARTSAAFFCAAAVALLCSVAVFFVLFHRDSSVPRSAQSSPPKASPAPAIRNELTVVMPPPLTPEPVPAKAAPQRTNFKLRRVRRYSDIGPLHLRLVRVNVKNKTCDILSRPTNKAPNQIRIQLNRPVRIPQSQTQPVELVINAITSSAVSGFIQTGE